MPTARTDDAGRLGAWLASRDLAVASLERLPGGASPRSYWRVGLATPLPNGRASAIARIQEYVDRP